MKPAILPDELVNKPARYVRDLAMGETGLVPFTDVIVKEDRTCFLSLDAQLIVARTGSEIVARTGSVQVRLADDGFHVVVPSDIRYTPGKIRGSDANLAPVASITVRVRKETNA